MSYEDEHLQDGDPYLSTLIEEQPEPVQSLAVEPSDFLGRALEKFRSHKKGITELGALGVGTFGIGLAVAGVVSSHHRH